MGVNMRIFIIFVFSLFLIRPAVALDVTFLEMNAEFFFDHQEPHGRVVGTVPNMPVPTEAEWKAKAKRIAQKIDDIGANIVAMIEVENRTVMDEVKKNLANADSWHVIFKEGRDNYTGQDVALLSKFAPDWSSVTNFPDEHEIYVVDGKEQSTSPSKALGVRLTVSGQPVYVIVGHLISRRSSNDAKRHAQASVIRRQAIKAMNRGENVIVSGDMNDTPGTPVLKLLRGFDDIWGDMFQTANEIPKNDRYTYTYRNKKNLLDHILISPS